MRPDRPGERSGGDAALSDDQLPPGPLPALLAIGVVRTNHVDRAHTPVQSALNPAETGTIELDPRFAAALDGLEEFDYAWVLSWLGDLHSSGRGPGDRQAPLRQVPFLLQSRPREIGVLATRGPRRLNPIGLSLVRILDVTAPRIRFAGVDLVDGTPVVDIKPYVTRFDHPPTGGGEVACGWFDTVSFVEGSTPTSLDPGGG